MNNWNPLETQLRSWTPRAPSPKLKLRLFGLPAPAAANAAGRTRTSSQPAAWPWMAPAMAVFLVGLFLYGGNLTQLPTAGSHSLLATAALSEPGLAAYFSSTHHSDNNTWQAPFEWTNGNRSMTTAPSMAQTNALTP